MTALATLTRVQFRTPGALGDRLLRRSREWSVSEGEAARRLTVLADCALSIDDHDQVVEIASALQTSFVNAVSVLSTQRGLMSTPLFANTVRRCIRTGKERRDGTI